MLGNIGAFNFVSVACGVLLKIIITVDVKSKLFLKFAYKRR